MIEETAAEVKRRIPCLKKVGLLASMGVYKAKIYNHFFQKFEIEVIFPDMENQEKVMKVIHAVKAGDLSDEVKKDIIAVSQNLIDKRAEAIIAGCTEIPLILKEEEVPVPLIDPTQILARIAVQKAK